MVIHDVSIYSIIKRNARLYKDGTALISGLERISYHELFGKVDRLATGLQARSLKSGERIGVLAKNSLEYVYLYGAAARIGAILLPINWRLSHKEVKYVISDGSPAVLFADPEFQDTASPLISGADSPITCFSTGVPRGDFRAFSELMEEGELTSVAKVGSDDRCVIIHTAAVQGRPRGAILTHRGDPIYRRWSFAVHPRIVLKVLRRFRQAFENERYEFPFAFCLQVRVGRLLLADGG